jgi:hypothetical protein
MGSWVSTLGLNMGCRVHIFTFPSHTGGQGALGQGTHEWRRGFAVRPPPPPREVPGAGAGAPAGQRRSTLRYPPPPPPVAVLPAPRLPRLQVLAPPRVRPRLRPQLPRPPPGTGATLPSSASLPMEKAASPSPPHWNRLTVSRAATSP